MLKRRAVIVGSAALGMLAVAGAAVLRIRNESEDYANAVRADYLEGRVADRYGWIMSDTEAARVPQTS